MLQALEEAGADAAVVRLDGKSEAAALAELDHIAQEVLEGRRLTESRQESYAIWLPLTLPPACPNDRPRCSLARGVRPLGEHALRQRTSPAATPVLRWGTAGSVHSRHCGKKCS